MESNPKATPEYWNERVRESNGNEMALVYEDNHGFAESTRIGEELIRLFVRPGMSVLDVGCGYGRFYPAFKRAGAEYTGIDFSEAMIEEAKLRNPEGNFISGNWKTFEGKYDVVFECICLSSYDGKGELADTLTRYCNNGGIAIMVEPNMIGVLSTENLFLR